MEKKIEPYEKITSVIDDDHLAFREGLRELLMEADGMRAIGEMGEREEASALTMELNPDGVIMDINIPEVNGIGAAKRSSILRHAPGY